MDNKKKTESIQLLEELIEEILSRLPAKSLLKFRCVSQSWRSLIDSKLFIKKHLQNMTKNKSRTHWRVVYDCPYNHGVTQRSMQSGHDEPDVDPSPFDDPNNHHLTVPGVYVVGHCDGVLCVRKEPGSFFLWNPTTRISIELPKIEHTITKYGFGWDEESDAYKVFVGISDKDKGKNIGKVYSTKTNSWRDVEHGSLSLYRNYKYGKFASGNIHWLSEGGLCIETFDLKSEVCGTVENPNKPEVGVSMRLSSHLGFLAILFENNETKKRRLSVMNEYGAEDSWAEKKVRQSKTTTPTCCHVVGIHYYIESLVSLES